VGGLKHQKEKRSMDHFAGLDVSWSLIMATSRRYFRDKLEI
jgi:hypothetical protein